MEALRGLYVRLDAELTRVPLTCKACGRCCHFADFDHVLYLSNLEAMYLCRTGVPAGAAAGACPFLVGPRCSAHPRRALGCRTFSCDKQRREALQALYETYYRQIKRLAEQTGIEWSYAPLSEQIKALWSPRRNG
jgi:Fe-S-cluster containining protein